MASSDGLRRPEKGIWCLWRAAPSACALLALVLPLAAAAAPSAVSLASPFSLCASVSLSSDSTPVDYRNPMAIDFDIGLWKVCPSVKEWIHSEYASKFDTNSTLWLEPPSPKSLTLYSLGRQVVK